MLMLLETPAGYGLFRVTDERLLQVGADEVSQFFESVESARSCVVLSAFTKFKRTEDAVSEAVALAESRLGKSLRKFLSKNCAGDDSKPSLGVCDRLLGVAVQQSLGIDVVYSPCTVEIIRGIRSQFFDLVSGLASEDVRAMSLALSHSLIRFRLKFSPDKVDVMIVQAISLLDDLDRDANNFAMRLKEWYGWHFPELSRIVSDNLLYARIVSLIQTRENVPNVREALTQLVSAQLFDEVCKACEISMGGELTTDDVPIILELAQRLVEMLEYRQTLHQYLVVRMRALAPNLTYMVGEVIGARLLSHSGSLMSLAKHPASTVQILGAEKALFRALKTKAKTPKYGIIYHAALVGQAQLPTRGKISRMLAAKLALCIRVDALAQSDKPTVAIENRKYIEDKLDQLSREGAIQQHKRPGTSYKPKWPEKRAKPN